MWLDLGGSEITTTTKYTITSGEGLNTIISENGITNPSVIVRLRILDLSLADGGTYTCRGVRGGESVTQFAILEGAAPPTTPPPLTTPPLTSQRSLAPSNVLLPIVYGLVSIVTILVIALLLLVVFIIYLLRKVNKTKNSLIRSTEAVQVSNSLSIQEKEDTSIYVRDVIYEEISKRRVVSLTKNEAYVCVSTPLEK